MAMYGGSSSYVTTYDYNPPSNGVSSAAPPATVIGASQPADTNEVETVLIASWVEAGDQDNC